MKILVSACLLGEKCKYNGSDNKNDEVIRLGEKHTLIPVCPEVFGGLPTPRPPCEIVGSEVVNSDGEVVTEQFLDGAEKALYVAEEAGCTVAVLKENSPSCGFGKIYDGTFSHRLIYGNGILGQLLYDHGITVIGENRLDKLEYL